MGLDIFPIKIEKYPKMDFIVPLTEISREFLNVQKDCIRVWIGRKQITRNYRIILLVDVIAEIYYKVEKVTDFFFLN